jgi:gluconate 2-dehydrogenase gamma chain
VVTASAAVAPLAISCDDEPSPRERGQQELDRLREAPVSYADNVPIPPAEIQRDRLGFFSPAEAATVEALVARILPGTADDPGAREAGVLTFIDVKLTSHEGFWEPTYREPPFAEAVEGDVPPRSEQPDPFTTVKVSKDEIKRYGFQSMLTPRESYRMGLAALDAHSRSSMGARFSDLDEAQQDAIIGRLVEGDVPEFDSPTADGFFDMVQEDVIYGMFGDPAYGGNVDMAGWRLISYPGAQRGYTPEDLQTESSNREPQSLAQLHAYMEGHNLHDNAVLPVSSAHQHE